MPSDVYKSTPSPSTSVVREQDVETRPAFPPQMVAAPNNATPDTNELAKHAIAALVQHVAAHRGRPLPSLAYQELATRIERLDHKGDPHARGMGSIILKRVGEQLEGLTIGWREKVPDLQCLVGAKDDPLHLPEDGIRQFWRGYDRLNRAERVVRVNAEKQKIQQFGSRWNEVLQYLKLPTERLPGPSVARRAGPESLAHKELKDYVASNPSLFGVSRKAEVQKEYWLPSSDEIDVLFKESDCWTAVEVKSAVSEGVTGDYERGVYQVVKYSAILNAMRSDSRYGVSSQVRAFLVVERPLPEPLKLVAKALGISIHVVATAQL